MKLIYYCDFLESYATNLAIAVAAESNEVALILRDIPVLRERRADEALLEGRPANLGVDAQELAGGYSSIKSVVAVCKMYRQKRQAGYDVFHVQQTGDPRFLWLAMRMRALTLHEPCPRDGVTSGVGRWLELAHKAAERVYRRLADLIVVHTESGLKSLSLREQRKAIVIPHGADFRSALPVNDSKTILFLVERRRTRESIHCLRRWPKSGRPSRKHGCVFSPARGLPARLGAGRQDPCDVGDTPNMSSTRSCWLLALFLYALPVGIRYRVGAQAYASGRPIVASNLDGLREFVAHEELLVQPEDVLDLARALKVVLGKDYGTQAIDHERTWQGVAAAHIRAYRSLLSATAGNRALLGDVDGNRIFRNPKRPSGIFINWLRKTLLNFITLSICRIVRLGESRSGPRSIRGLRVRGRSDGCT